MPFPVSPQGKYLEMAAAFSLFLALLMREIFSLQAGLSSKNEKRSF